MMERRIKLKIELKKEIESEIQTLSYLIVRKREQVRQLNLQIMSECPHKWVDDMIDCLESSQKITYCTRCELSK